MIDGFSFIYTTNEFSVTIHYTYKITCIQFTAKRFWLLRDIQGFFVRSCWYDTDAELCNASFQMSSWFSDGAPNKSSMNDVHVLVSTASVYLVGCRPRPDGRVFRSILALHSCIYPQTGLASSSIHSLCGWNRLKQISGARGKFMEQCGEIQQLWHRKFRQLPTKLNRCWRRMWAFPQVGNKFQQGLICSPTSCFNK